MCAPQCLRVPLLLLVTLLLRYCKPDKVSEEDLFEYDAQLIVRNRRLSIGDCRFSYERTYAAGGTPTYKREFAHMTALGWSQADGSTVWNCGGSLIYDNWVLTAAHCAADNANNEPDVARFGDQDLYDDEDDEYAQQRKIVEIVRHPEHMFSKRYHDIALMRLETKISIHDTVVPACLWNDDEVRFKALVATGWGAIGFYQKHSPVLLKVYLSPVDSDMCSRHYIHTRGLHDGLHANQLCAGDSEMDTCPGDSGGPIQVKLLHNSRVIPFVVGVTSFGNACGHSVPAVYTKVAPYIPWIRSVLNRRGENGTEWMFEPQACAIQYAQQREFEPVVVTRTRQHLKALDYNSAHLLLSKKTLHVATIHWDGTNEVKQTNCVGVVIDQSTILTLARCTAIDGIPPSYIRYKGNKTNAVSSSFTHPYYTINSLQYDIGLLKLENPLMLSSSFFPACLWHILVASMEVLGHGRKDLNKIFPVLDMASNETVDLKGKIQIFSSCSLPAEFTSRLVKESTDEYLCFGTKHYLVPGTCNLSLGGSGPQSKVVHRYHEFNYVYALNLFGKNCDYSESAVGVKISKHTEWLQSVLLPQERKEVPDAPLVFLHSELEEGDRCNAPGGSDGKCVQTQYCPKVVYEIQTEGEVRFCQTASLVCCPQEFIRNETDAEWREIDECEEVQLMHRKPSRIDQSLVSIAWRTKTNAKTCIGTIITSRTIITAADCVVGATFRTILSIKHGTTRVLIAVKRISIHPHFDGMTKMHNIALIKVQNRLRESLGKVSACLWTNSTHTPLYLTQVSHNKTLKSIMEHRATYCVDCTRPFGRILQPHELCVHTDAVYDSNLFVYLDALVLWEKHPMPGNSIPYLVGIGSRQSSNESDTFLHTRVSSYVSWIKSVL